MPLRFPAVFPALAKWVASAVYYTSKQRIRQPRAVRRGPNEVTDMKDLAAMQSFERSRLDRSKLCSFDNETIEAPTAPLIHQEARFLYICEGHGVIRIQGHDVELRPNTLLSILPWQITAVTEVAEPLQYHLVIYNLHTLNRYIRAFSDERARYGRGDADYLNCPFNKAEYEAFHAALAAAERAPLHDFDTGAEQSARPDPDAHGKKADTVTVYEGCMPIEIMAARGADTMRFGPLRPVGLIDPRTGHRPWANVQLRAENKERTLYNIVGFQTNLKWGEQKRVFSMIPGLENAEFVRYGVMHRNTFLDAPRVLSAGLCLKEHPNVFFAGQITGFEGYMESAACGLLAARNIYARLEGKELPAPPIDTMCGALIQYLTTENKHFQPMGANMGILPPLPEDQRPRDKRLRYMAVAERAVASFQQWLDENSL